MKIYILRHEDRTIDATFFAPLTENGLNNANNLIPILEKLNITRIFCSPYIRTMQTIYPFSKKKNMRLNLEYSLIEIQHESIIPPNSHSVELPLYIAKEFNYNSEYVSTIKSIEISYPENQKLLEKRTKKFLKQIINNYYKTNENILFVTHQGLCNVFLNIINKFGQSKPDIQLLEGYPLGCLSLIFENNQWNYKKIN